MTKWTKETTGVAIQHYEDGICVKQEFVAGDEVEHLYFCGSRVQPPGNAQYQPFDMVQPGKEKEIDYYVIWMWKCTEPQLYGPYSTPEKQQAEIDRLRTEHGEDDHTFFVMNVTKGAKLEF